MKLRMLFASTMTLGMLAGMVLTILVILLFWGGIIPAGLMLVLTVMINFVSWLITPFFTDLIQGWVYDLRKLTFEQFEAERPELAGFVRRTCEAKRLPLPRIRLINDDNPTAYTYGSWPGNARLVGSNGLFRFLDLDEQCAVFAHELGHIKHLDFIVMTVAATMLQILYEMGHILLRMRRGKNNPLPLIGLMSLVFYWVGSYLLLLLSRAREYLADRFAAEVMGDPAPLQRALVKVAYGMAEMAQLGKENRLLKATRSMGIFDHKAAHGVGNALRASADFPTDGSAALQPQVTSTPAPAGFDPQMVAPVMLFDLYNPWAFVSELASTHPLTGKRLRALNEAAGKLGVEPLFDFAAVDREGQKLDRGRLYGRFFVEVVIYYGPWLGLGFGLLLAAISAAVVPQAPLFPAVFGFLGLGMLLKGLYRFSAGKDFEPITMYELMSDPYASPLRGRPVQLDGSIIGKAQAGAYFGEDVTMKDRSGGLVNLNYESLIPFLGNLLFAFRGAKQAQGSRATARGWFRRSVHQFVDLADMDVDGKTVRSWTRFWGIFGGVVVTGIGLVSLVPWALLLLA
jgi:Zn-dependent protease with chaperone function